MVIEAAWLVMVGFSPLRQQGEIGRAVAKVTDQMGHLCGAFDSTRGELVLGLEVQKGPWSDGLNGNLEGFSVCHED